MTDMDDRICFNCGGPLGKIPQDHHSYEELSTENEELRATVLGLTLMKAELNRRVAYLEDVLWRRDN